MFVNDKEEFAIDSITISAITKPDTTAIVIKAPFAKAYMKGKYKLTEIGTALSNTISKYYSTAPASAKKANLPQQFDFGIVVDNDPIIYKLIPQIKRLEPIKIEGSYNSATDSITIKGAIPRIVYGANTISGVTINVHNQEDALAYNLVIDQVQNDQFLLSHTDLSGEVKDNIVTYKLQIQARKKEDQYLVAGQMHSTDKNTELSLYPDGLTLNYESWKIAEGKPYPIWERRHLCQ